MPGESPGVLQFFPAFLDESLNPAYLKRKLTPSVRRGFHPSVVHPYYEILFQGSINIGRKFRICENHPYPNRCRQAAGRCPGSGVNFGIPYAGYRVERVSQENS
jgi:hypothetical protein